jgi:virulence factor Mce-like protein
MKNRSGISGVASSPILVGAITVLVVIVAVFLAYNANNGLPFVSTYNLKARVPNADALVKGNEVRIGGVRVGVVKKVVPVQLGDGKVAAELSLSLDKNAEPLPVDSTITVRPKSALGLKFLQVTPGDSDEGFKAGETIPVSSAKPEPVDIDEFFAMFDKPTRDAIRQNLSGFGNALAGRGPQLNEAFGALRRAAESGQPILRKIVEPSSDFAGFWRGLEALSATVAPVAETQATMFRALDTTFAAFARVSRPYIQETIEKSPPTLDEVNADLPAVRPFLEDSARFFTALRPGVRALAKTSPVIAESLHAGIPVLNASPVLTGSTC